MFVSTDPDGVAENVLSTSSTAFAPGSVYVHPTSIVIGLSPIMFITGAVTSTTFTVRVT